MFVNSGKILMTIKNKEQRMALRVNQLVLVEMGEADDIIGFIQGATSESIVIRMARKSDIVHIDPNETKIIPVDSLPLKERKRVLNEVYH